MRTRVRTSLLAIIAGAVAVVLLAPGLVDLGASWLWMQEIGYQTVFLREVGTRLALVAGVGVLAFAFLRANLYLAQLRHRPPVRLDGDIAALTGLRARAVERRLALVAAVAAVLVGLTASGGWLAVLRMRYGVPFGVQDPLFGRDVSFFSAGNHEPS